MIDHVYISVTDIDRSLAFYLDALQRRCCVGRSHAEGWGSGGSGLGEGPEPVAEGPQRVPATSHRLSRWL